MPAIVGSVSTTNQTQSNWSALAVPAAGSNRLHLYIVGVEENVADPNVNAATLSYKGEAWTKVAETMFTGTWSRGIAIFAAKEATIAAAEAAAPGDLIVQDGNARNCRVSGMHIGASITIENVDQSVDLNTIFAVVNDGTSLNLATNNGDLIIATGIASDPGEMTWTGATELTEWSGSSYDMSVASHDSSADETRAISYATDAGANFGPSVIALSFPATTVADSITAVSDVRLGESFTITTNGTTDLTTATTITATFGGITLTGQANITANTVDFTAPSGGLELNANNDVILTIDGTPTAAFSKTYLVPTGMQMVVLTTDDFVNESVLSFYEGAGANNIGIGDQWIVDQTTNENSLTININSLGLFTIVNGATNPAQTFDWFYLDAQDNYAASGTQTVTANPPSNQPPVISTIPDINVTAGSIGSYDLSQHVTDPEDDTLIYSITPALPSGITLNTNTGLLSWDGSQASS